MTSIRHLTEKILDNWVAKVVSLLIAILLYVFYQTSQIDKKTFSVPLKIVENGIVMHVGTPVTSVPVVVRTNDTIMNMVSSADFEAVADISSITESGTFDVPVQIHISERLMEQDPLEVILKEETVSIRVDRRAVKYVPLVPSVVGEVSHGYSIKEITISPSTVEISGPEAVINAIENIPSTRIMVSNAENSFSVETGVQEQAAAVRIRDTGPFTATVSLTTDIMEREFTEIPVDVIGLSQDLVIKNVLPTVSVRISGEVPSLEKYTLPGRFVSVNLRDVTEAGAYELPLRFAVPSSFSLVEKSMDKVSVIVELVPEEDEAPADEPGGGGDVSAADGGGEA